MKEMPESVRPPLRRLARRLAIGTFLDEWPMWAAASLLAGGIFALVCRLFFAAAAPHLHWLWLVPLVIAIPVVLTSLRAYRPDEVVAVADWLSGGHGMLLTLLEKDAPAWANSALVEAASAFTLPRFRPWRKLGLLPPSAVFLAVALLLPQRVPAAGADARLADDIAANLTASVMELKQQELITEDEQKKLEQEIERIRRGAQERVDASSWEASDALREKVAAGLSAKQDAIKWAEESLARYAASAQAGTGAAPDAEASAAELTSALEKLAQTGLLAGAPAELQRLLKGGKLPTDAASLRELTALMSKYLAGMEARLGDLSGSGSGRSLGRFDPSEFPLNASRLSPDGDGDPGRGGVNRGRADAPLTWGKESLPFDRFKAEALPPGAARSPDDWVPLVVLPGAPQESPTLSAQSAARHYGAAAGQSAWRRTLAPRHQSAVKRYFEK